MDSRLLTQSLVKFFLGVVVLGLLLFLPAGSFRYWQGWLLMGILFVPMFVAGLFLLSYILYAEVLRENTYLSRTIEV